MIKYKVLYVLTDDEKLKYYKEFKISVLSVKKYNPNIDIEVLIDDDTFNIINNVDSNGLNGIVNYKIIKSIEGYSKMMMSRWMKTSMRNLVSGDFLYIDTDTIICRELESIPDDMDLAMTYNRHCDSIKNTFTFDYIKNKFSSAQIEFNPNDCYYNAGVIFVRDNEFNKEFFKQWNEKWIEGTKFNNFTDQQSLYFVNKKNNNYIKTLEDKWNVQITTIPFPINHLDDAIIIHSCGMMDNVPYLLSQQSTYDNLSLTNNEEIYKIIDNPKKLFIDGYFTTINYETYVKEQNIKNSYVYQCLSDKYCNIEEFEKFNNKFKKYYEFSNKVKKLFKK